MTTGISEPTQDQLNALVAPYLETQPTGLGFVIGYAGPGFEGIFRAGNLVNHWKNPIDFNNDTPFELASVSKTFTATLYAVVARAQGWNTALTLGDLSLGIGTQFSNIPVVSLVNYTSGLPADSKDATDFPPFLPKPYSVAGMLGYLNATDMSPTGTGEHYTYSNLGFGIMGGAVIPQLAGSKSTYEDLVRDNIFTPLGLSAAFFADIRIDQLPLGYDYKGTEPQPSDPGWEFFPAYDGAGGIVASANGMMTWLKFNMGLSENTVLTSLLPVLQSPSTAVTTSGGDGLGLGWFMRPASDTTFATVWKDGDLSGFSSFITFLPSSWPGEIPSQAGVFVLMNCNGLKNESGAELSAVLANDVLCYMQGLTPPSDKSVYPSRRALK